MFVDWFTRCAVSSQYIVSRVNLISGLENLPSTDVPQNLRLKIPGMFVSQYLLIPAFTVTGW